MRNEPVTWVILAGLPGTGKSTLARALAGHAASAGISSAVLDKDRVREALFPGPLTDYTREQDNLCMAAIYEAAAYLTQRAAASLIVLDGRTYAGRAQRAAAIRAAEAAGARWKIVHVTCPDEVAEARLSQQQAGHPAQNRTPELYRQLKAQWEPISSSGGEPHLVVEMRDRAEKAAENAAGEAAEEAAEEVLRYLHSGSAASEQSL